jgi:hypothetical protein
MHKRHRLCFLKNGHIQTQATDYGLHQTDALRTRPTDAGFEHETGEKSTPERGSGV